MNSALISIHPGHVQSIVSGLKTIEIRKRRMNLPAGSTLWIYSTLPTGKVEASATIDFIVCDSPRRIWTKYKNSMGLSKGVFDSYVNGKEKITAIGLKNIRLTDKQITLQLLREFDHSFIPPQFYIKLTKDKKVYPAFE